MAELTESIAKAYGGEAKIEFFNTSAITYNDPDLVIKMLPSLTKVVGETNVTLSKAITGAEDFSYFQEVVPGFYFFLGGQPTDKSNKDTLPLTSQVPFTSMQNLKDCLYLEFTFN